jgi:catechol 2,3-dioxygenase
MSAPVTDAEVPLAQVPLTTGTPLCIGAVGLAVRALARVADFYCDAVGLAVLERCEKRAVLGLDGIALLHLEHAPDAPLDDPRQAGLFHTAFLMPTRTDLAHWYLHMRRHAFAISRAAGHGVNEAIYYDDPEGNGVECYADRPPQTWRWHNGRVDISIDPLDLDALARAADGTPPYLRAPAGLRIGHVNLRVGDLDAAERFYGAAGLELTCRRDDMTFMSSGRYHHHLAANIRTSAGAGRRDERCGGLAWLAFTAADTATRDASAARLRAAGAVLRPIPHGFETRDPWGLALRVVCP